MKKLLSKLRSNLMGLFVKVSESKFLIELLGMLIIVLITMSISHIYVSGFIAGLLVTLWGRIVNETNIICN